MAAVKTEIDDRYKQICPPTKFQRRPKQIGFKTWIACEWKNLVLCGFTIVVDVLISKQLYKLAEMFLHFAFLVRWVEQSQSRFQEYQNSNRLCGEKIMKKFYKLYQSNFGIGACAPNIHLFSHLVERRRSVEMIDSTTEPFETFYGLVRHMYCTGTDSQGQQIIHSVLLYYLNDGVRHKCIRGLTIRPKLKDMREDNWVESTKGPFKILGVVDKNNQNFKAARVVTMPYSPKYADELPWDYVWVRRYVGISNCIVNLEWTEIISKCVVIENKYIISLPEGGLFG